MPSLLANWDKYVQGANVIALPVRGGVGGVNKNFNFGHNLETIKDGALIFHMCIPCGKTLHMVP